MQSFKPYLRDQSNELVILNRKRAIHVLHAMQAVLDVVLSSTNSNLNDGVRAMIIARLPYDYRKLVLTITGQLRHNWLLETAPGQYPVTDAISNLEQLREYQKIPRWVSGSERYDRCIALLRYQINAISVAISKLPTTEK